ncbi:cell envelope integrity protein TolA [Canicola haemoglobinophilus]|uniref:Cell envelope integrity inner membrane protein TolA n=1 Tax=Canicola haemoglobinophilus TaxID=733 RepID=A0A1V4B1H5_9PAST|nr:cell envelope integrity protein TolA [Canicola haemoglobinophilus]OOS00975.1 cell envelope integrity protein TolA [Canicola haemoglobinophilus]STO59152.1 cell envelope integrity inner membrane protein TolA [Canicola haemoglobinophilus]
MRNHRKNKGIDAIFISVILHAILFALLMLGSLYHNVEIMGGGEGDGEVISAVMVDTGSAAREWGRLQEQKKGSSNKPQMPIESEKEDIQKEKIETPEEKIKEQQEQKKLAEQKLKEEKVRQELLEKQALEKQKQLEEATAKKAAEAAKLKAEAEAKRLQALAKQAEEEKKAKAAAEAKQKAEKLEKEKAEKLAKEKAEKLAKEKEAKEKAIKEAKIQAEKEAKAKADMAKRKAEQAALDSFLNGGDIGGGSAKVGGNATVKGSEGIGAGLGTGEGGNTGDQYAAQIKKEIQRRFLKEPGFANKVCVVEVELARDGTITSFRKLSGPDDICTAGLSAVSRTKKVPAAPSDDIYRKYKKFPLEFKLK